MIVLHLQCKKDGTVRLMLNKDIAGQAQCIASRLLTDENAKRIYEAIFNKTTVEKICPRIHVRGLGWVNPYDI